MIYNRFFSLIFLLSFFTNITLSQEPARCGTDEIHEFNMQNDDEYKRSYFELQKKFGISQNVEPTPRSFSNEVYSIPVVVHVFHDGDPLGEDSNISDEIIYDAIAALNADFMGESFFPANNTGAPFFNAPVDVDIEFCLATVDPDGNPTNGITRQNPDSIAGYTQNGMVTTSILAENSELALKSLCYWPIAEYCNIYVVHKLNGGGSPLGFAYLPPTSNLRDGIVVFRNVFGFNNNGNQNGQLYSNFNENKTLTHEMGHYLGLRHTFNNTSGCGPETNCAAQGDALCDTPPTTGSAGCGPLTCYETMTENFMDYSNDDCMDRFSPDGRTRMRNQLLQYRSGLLDNGNCASLDGVDVGVSSISISSTYDGCTENFDDVGVMVYNSPYTTVNSIDMIYQLDDGPVELYTWYGTLEPGGNVEITLPNINISYGEHELTVWAYNPNLVPDIYPNNDEASISFNNEAGTEIDITINFDALPYGFTWILANLDTGELIAGGGGFQNAEYSCESETYTFCLPEGNYELILEDIFGNGMHYWCQVYEGPGSIIVTSGNDTITSAEGDWGDEEILPFYIGPPSAPCPDYPCRLDLDDNGIVGVSDIILILNQFGQSVEPCAQIDFNDDGIVGVDDVLDLLSLFGLICETGNIENSEIPQNIKDTIYQVTGIDLNTLSVADDIAFPLPININVNQLETLQDVAKVIYYDISGRQVNRQNVKEGIYIAQIFLIDGRIETVKFYQN